MGFRPLFEDEMRAREARAVRDMDRCAPRLPEGGGGCLWPKSLEFVRDRQNHVQLLPCNNCKVCRERALRAETSLIMCEVHTSDWAVFATPTYADPMSDFEAQCEAQADANDPLLTAAERVWRSANREQRLLREGDLATDWLCYEHARDFVKRLNALGQRQGRDAVRAYKREEIAAMVQGAARLWPRRSGESKRAYKSRVAQFRRGAKAGYMSRPDRDAVEAGIRAKLGFKLRAWVVGQYGGKTGRAHWHLIICGSGAFPKTWPKAKYRGQTKHDFLHLPQWPHGHVQLDYNVNEGRARYLARYLSYGRGVVVNVSDEGPEPPPSAFFFSPWTGKMEKRPFFKRPRKAGHDYARRLGEWWADCGMLSPDFKVYAPGCRDQAPKFERGSNGQAVKVHNGRASIMSGSRARVALLTYAECMGYGLDDLRREASRRDYFTRERVEKLGRFLSERDRRQNRVAYALDDAEALAAQAARSSPSVAGVVAQSWDARDAGASAYPFAQHVRAWELAEGHAPAPAVSLFEAERAAADAEAREAFALRFREGMKMAFRSLGPKVSEGPERQAYLASLEAVRDGRLVYEGGDWVWRSQGPAPWEGLAGPP